MSSVVTERINFRSQMAGHAESWDEVHIDGDLEKFACTVTYKSGDAALAVATIEE
jgi:hypothetical protein